MLKARQRRLFGGSWEWDLDMADALEHHRQTGVARSSSIDLQVHQGIRMQIIIVADQDLADFGRRMSHAISSKEDCDAAFLTLKHYRDNETQISGRQPIIFLGDNDFTKPLTEDIPERFRAYRTKCWHDGGKAVLIADTPTSVSCEDMNEIGSANMEFHKGFIHHKDLDLFDFIETYGSLGPLFFVCLVSGPWWFWRLISDRQRAMEYRKLQYQYVVFRFIKDELENFIRVNQGQYA